MPLIGRVRGGGSGGIGRRQLTASLCALESPARQRLFWAAATFTAVANLRGVAAAAVRSISARVGGAAPAPAAANTAPTERQRYVGGDGGAVVCARWTAGKCVCVGGILFSLPSASVQTPRSRANSCCTSLIVNDHLCGSVANLGSWLLIDASIAHQDLGVKPPFRFQQLKVTRSDRRGH